MPDRCTSSGHRSPRCAQTLAKRSRAGRYTPAHPRIRSEEHTSELQSRPHLVPHSLPTRRSSDLGLPPAQCLHEPTKPVLPIALGDDDLVSGSAVSKCRIGVLRPAIALPDVLKLWPKEVGLADIPLRIPELDRKSTRLNSSHVRISSHTLSLHDALPISGSHRLNAFTSRRSRFSRLRSATMTSSAVLPFRNAGSVYFVRPSLSPMCSNSGQKKSGWPIYPCASQN